MEDNPLSPETWHEDIPLWLAPILHEQFKQIQPPPTSEVAYGLLLKMFEELKHRTMIEMLRLAQEDPDLRPFNPDDN